MQTAIGWAGPEVASRIRFTDVAPKETHITRCCVADLVLDTAEVGALSLSRCNHSNKGLPAMHENSAAPTLSQPSMHLASELNNTMSNALLSVLWSGTPIIACLWPSHRHKMASRVSASLAYATGLGKQMVVHSREEYEERAVALASACYDPDVEGPSAFGLNGGTGCVSEGLELLHLRQCLFLRRETMPLFDTRRWVKNLEKGFIAAWKRWVDGSQFRVGYNDEGAIVVRDDDDTSV